MRGQKYQNFCLFLHSKCIIFFSWKNTFQFREQCSKHSRHKILYSPHQSGGSQNVATRNSCSRSCQGSVTTLTWFFRRRGMKRSLTAQSRIIIDIPLADIAMFCCSARVLNYCGYSARIPSPRVPKINTQWDLTFIKRFII